MVPHFIEVHLADDDCSVSLNLEHIIGISDTDNNGSGYAIKTSDRGGWYVRESYADIKALIQKAGCQITKADPRLDTSHPIPWEDLVKLEMLGQPVFNSNTRKWMLVIDSAGPYTHDWITLLNTAGGLEHWNEHDVQARPLYRMRKEM